MVEPQAAACARLRELYAGHQEIVIVEAAVHETPGSRAFYTVEAREMPAWVASMASFDRANILKHAPLIPGLEGMIRERQIECVTFAQILERLPDIRLDLLQIDTEGADAHLLSLFPFERVRPLIVHWEVKHMSKPQREKCLGRLASFGYIFAPSGAEDMVAVLESSTTGAGVPQPFTATNWKPQANRSE